MPEMTPREAAAIIEKRMKRYHPSNAITAASQLAIDALRQLAAGEYKQVVHARWVDDGRGHYCSHCKGYITQTQWTVYKNPHCPYCGALMDGKDDSHEQK